ncbi:hypothetical protein M885DRAFT_513245 [Pelagophyceae sp. CCMP2097]|nr:hypothetical protein M885DRAFT_513245 [Pelagophyceae sp. CCMP2097]
MIVAGPEGRPCGCGSRGCLEAYASANAVSKMYSEETGAEATCAAVFAKALEGESAAMRVVDVSARHLALGCINLLRILDPQVVVLGGGMAAAGEALLAAVRRHVEELGWNCLPKCADRIRLVGAGPHAGCIGAAKAALDAAGSDVPPAPTHPPSPPVS